MADSLRSWLVQQNQDFIKAFSRADLKDWVLCVGNEAGDLDTLSCSIAFAYLSNFEKEKKERYIPIQLTPSSAFQLRAENMAALKDAMGIDSESSILQNDLICSDTLDFTKFTSFGAKYALLDHNEIISSIFGNKADVIAIIDHHEPANNNQLYPLAKPRIIQVPTGSCSALVTNYFAPTWENKQIPIGLADLLLSALIIDTANLKPISEGGKATETDLLAKAFLLPRSRFAQSIQSTDLSNIDHSNRSIDSDNLNKLYKYLSNLKSDVTRLNSTQLLQRDYKQYEINDWKFGLSTIPIGLNEWVKDKESNDWKKLLNSINEYGVSKNLDAVGMITNLKLKKNILISSNQSRHVKELLLLIRNHDMLPLFKNLENLSDEDPIQQQLNLSNLSLNDHQNEIDTFTYSNNVNVKIWNIGNTHATRKQVAPILINLVNNLGPKPL
ncbi:hypothetical protein CROQUDRAFT_717784 [Cronartium quercuum f. sp. fusiforme G11]|uniref:DHHA2 domain-containing protein n=1 Tax=Cronartium quercuum f. sp. fusiforme G11 TaxID=708437 RepID=A0A9P6NEL2_9BASI|nr:hypothetical protein CROQUDRAFT_717784 [Cronartium quercuum f. sp. fusiforme G11]